MILYLWPMLLLVGSWITVTHFSGVSLSSIFINYSASKTVQIVSNTSKYTSITPVLKKLHWLPVEHRSVFKTATLVHKFLHIGFPNYFAPYISSYSSSYSTRRSQSGGNFLVILSSFNAQSINLSNSLVIVLLLMLPLFGMLFLRRVPLSGLLQKIPQNLPTSKIPQNLHTPRHTLLSFTYPLAFSVVLGLFSVPGY